MIEGFRTPPLDGGTKGTNTTCGPSVKCYFTNNATAAYQAPMQETSVEAAIAGDSQEARIITRSELPGQRCHHVKGGNPRTIRPFVKCKHRVACKLR